LPSPAQTNPSSPQCLCFNLHPLIKLLYREQSCYRDKVYGAVGRRAVVMVFASPSANLYTGSNSRCLSGLSHRDNFIVTANLSPLIGTVQKHMPTPTQTSTNPNPLAVSIYAGAKASGQITYSMTVFASITDRTNANQKSRNFITPYTPKSLQV